MSILHNPRTQTVQPKIPIKSHKNWKKQMANDQNINPYAQNIIPHAKKKKKRAL